jgi:hypothetical protein
MNDPLIGIETLMFCDETKFSVNDGDHEDAIYYFCVAVNKSMAQKISKEFKEALSKNKIQAPTFHSTTIFKEIRPREQLMNDICNLIVKNRLHCFCFKYSKASLFESTKALSYLDDNNLFNFKSQEFQALFYLLIILNTHLRDHQPEMLSRDIVMYFDRNVYGKTETEAFNFPTEHFVVKRMTFSEKSLISLLSLPDFLGYIFRKSKKSQNKVQFGNNELEKSNLVINSYLSILEIEKNGLFHFLEIDNNNLQKALGNLIPGNTDNYKQV